MNFNKKLKFHQLRIGQVFKWSNPFAICPWVKISPSTATSKWVDCMGSSLVSTHTFGAMNSIYVRY